jgi:hypothetical protein
VSIRRALRVVKKTTTTTTTIGGRGLSNYLSILNDLVNFENSRKHILRNFLERSLVDTQQSDFIL